MKKRNKSREDLKTNYSSGGANANVSNGSTVKSQRSALYRSESRELFRGLSADSSSIFDYSDNYSDDESEVASEYEMNELEHSMSTPNFFSLENRQFASYRSNSKSEMASLLPMHNLHIINTISVVSILLYVSAAAVIYVVYYTDMLVHVPPISAISKDPSAFNHIQARHYLKKLVAFGPRVVGSDINERQVPSYLQKELTLLEKDISTSTNMNLDIDIQRVSGQFHHRFLHGFTNVYSNVTNVVARLYPKHLSKKDLQVSSSILVNAHFDSFVTSPGAADDGVGVAVMLDVIRAFAHDSATKRFPVVFLFNGAEENNQQASHGFITQHPWSKTVRVIINLEAIGTGGRELVFQCNSDWVASLYTKHVPYPSISVLAHEFFKHILWRVAYTDWATFIEYGRPGIVGIDSAYTDNGYVYHTPSDVEKYIPDKTIQHTGVNLLSMLKSLQLPRKKEEKVVDRARLSEDYAYDSHNQMDASEEARLAEADLYKNYRISSGVVFYDVLGLVGIVYSGWNVVIIHLLVAAGALFISLRATSVNDITRSIGRIFVPSMVISFVLVALASSGVFDQENDRIFAVHIAPHVVFPLIGVAVVATLLNIEEIKVACRKKMYVFLLTVLGTTAFGFFISEVAPMKWYNGGLLCAMIMYIPPALVTHEYAQSSVGLRSVETNHRAGLIFVSIVVITLTFIGVLTCYVSVFNLVVACIAFVAFERTQVWTLHCMDSESAWMFAVISRSVLLLPGFVFLLQTGRSLVTLICAMFGKTGTVVPSEVIIGLFIGVTVASLSVFPLIGISIPDVMSPVFNADRYIKTLGKIYQKYDDHDESQPGKGTIQRAKNKVISKHFFDVKRKQTQCIELTPSRTSVLIVLATVTTLAVLYNMTVSSYSTERPKRLWIQHIKRTYLSLEGAVLDSDAGLWVQAFDVQGMAPIIKDALARGIENMDGRYFTYLRNSEDNCAQWSAECYIHWPYGYAVAEAMRQSFYIPAPEPPVLQEDALKVRVIMKSEDQELSLSSDASCAYRVVRFETSGPASQFLAIKDNDDTAQVVGFHIAAKTHHQVQDSEIFAHDRIELEPMPPLRPDGVYFFQIGFGLCMEEDHCTLQVALAICNSKTSLDVSVYGHYHDISSTPEMEELDTHLPVWSKGAEWSHHVSHLVNFKI